MKMFRMIKIAMPRATGFTVIELVITVLILGIVSAFAMTRIMGGDNLDAAIVSDQLVSMARSAQQKALGRSDVQLRVQPVGNNLDISIADSTGIVESASVASGSISLFGDVNQLSACNVAPSGALITNASPMVLNYNSLGDLLNGGVGGASAVETGARICLEPDTSLSVCISASGYAYRGDCLE